MGRIRILLALAAAMCAIGSVAFATTAFAGKSPEANMMQKVNRYRERHGVPRVKWARSLRRSARRYAWHMMRKGYFGHDKRIHASDRYRWLGEILEYQRGYKPNVKLAFRTWIRSDAHRAIILDRRFTRAGAGRAWGRMKGHKSTVWVMHFGRP